MNKDDRTPSSRGAATALFLGALLLPGCTLLFTAKGGMHYENGKTSGHPQAASLKKEMGSPVVVEYKVQSGDSFAALAQWFYGNPEWGPKIAKANHLSSRRKLKEGRVLKIVDPKFYHDPGDHPPPLAKNPASPKDSFLPTPTPTIEGLVLVPRPSANHAFTSGEYLKFEIRGLGVVGGYATLEVGSYVTVSGRPCYPLVLKDNSVFPVTPIFAVNDLQTSYFDSVDFLSWKFENFVHQGNYRAHNLETFDPLRHKMVRRHNEDKPEEKDLAPFSQDIISFLYYFRLLPLEEGKTYGFPVSSGGKNYQLLIKVFNREKVTVPAGTFDCLRVRPLVQEGTVFRNKGADIDLWLSADDRHIPVKVKTGIVIGSVVADLMEARLPPLDKQ